MGTYNNKSYKIVEIIDNDTNKRSEKWGYRTGRECYIKLAEVGLCMIVEYPNGGVFRTSRVQDIKIDNDSIIVKTLNRTYTFKNN